MRINEWTPWPLIYLRASINRHARQQRGHSVRWRRAPQHHVCACIDGQSRTRHYCIRRRARVGAQLRPRPRMLLLLSWGQYRDLLERARGGGGGGWCARQHAAVLVATGAPTRIRALRRWRWRSAGPLPCSHPTRASSCAQPCRVCELHSRARICHATHGGARGTRRCGAALPPRRPRRGALRLALPRECSSAWVHTEWVQL
jgi:hypothetical protein